MIVPSVFALVVKARVSFVCSWGQGEKCKNPLISETSPGFFKMTDFWRGGGGMTIKGKVTGEEDERNL